MEITKIPAKKLYKYPHLFPADIAIWERFLEKYSHLYKHFAYDVKVGIGRETPAGETEEMKRMWAALTKKRIDAIGFRMNFVDVIEVKPNASASALGQIITYTRLFEKEYITDRTIRPMIVTDKEEPDIRDLCREMGIIYTIV